MKKNKIAIRLLENEVEYENCYNLQKDIFGLSDKHAIPPALINLFNRSNPKIGYVLGAFHKANLVGFLITTSTANSNTVYSILLGIHKQFRGYNIGEKLFLFQKQLCINNNIETINFIYDPLEGNLAKLYIQKLGMKGIRYEPAVYILNKDEIPNDKILTTWKLKADVITPQINTKEELLMKYPICSLDHNKNEKFLVEIPGNFIHLKNKKSSKALNYRLQTRAIFQNYINERNYILDSFYSFNQEDIISNYYLLTKSS